VRDWVEWHRAYDDPSSALSCRLECVKLRLSEAIDRCPPGQLRLLSLCAGQGRDVIGVLPGHSRRDDVRVLLVEYDETNAEFARRGAAEADLRHVDVRQADAGDVANFADAPPANVLLLCGIFGNVSDADIERTVAVTPTLCAPGATVIWTRHRRPPDLTPRIREWFEASGFAELAFDALEGGPLIAVGAHQLVQAKEAKEGKVAAELEAGPLFTFRSRE